MRTRAYLLLAIVAVLFTAPAMAVASFDVELARDAILGGVTTVHSGQSTGHMVVYGDNAVPISWHESGPSTGATIAAAEWGDGRIVAVPDHQMFDAGTYGDEGTTAQFYENSIAWTTQTSSQEVAIITYDRRTSDWLNDNGYPNATSVVESELIGALDSADLFVGWLGPTESEANLEALASFVQRGGGLMLAEYGAGYTFWWTTVPVHEAPGNQLLREIGIGFTSTHSFISGLMDVNRANVTITLDDYYAVMADQQAHSDEQVASAMQLLGGIGDTLPADDPRPREMAAAFVSDVRATPNNPVTDAVEKATLQAEMEILSRLTPSQVTAHPTAEELYGAIPVDAPRLARQTVTVDASVNRWHSTGLYAVPGETVRVSVPTDVVDNGFRVLVNGHHDDISRRQAWHRVPFGVQRSFDLDAATVEIANAFGGAIYIDVGTVPPADIGIADFDVVIDNAIAAPYFVLGETTNAAWVGGIRDHPAPYAELETDGVILSVPSTYVRSLDDPEELMTFWDSIVEVQDYVAAHEHLRTMPDRINIDVQISVGYIHAGYPIQGPTSTTNQLTDLAAIRQNGSWGYFHELGHEMQRRPDKQWSDWVGPYTFDGDVEVTVNIFANAALEELPAESPLGGWGWSAFPNDVMDRALRSIYSGGTFDDKDPYPFYFQLADGFGWDTYRAVFGTYHDDLRDDPGALPTRNIEKKTQWLLRWSNIVGYDMRCYMVDAWDLQVALTATEAAALDELQCWLPVLGNTVDRTVEVGQSDVLDFAADARALRGDVTVAGVDAPLLGTLEDLGGGSYRYTARSAGVETLVYKLESSAGSTQQFEVSITVEAVPFACEANAGQLTWPDANVTKYWIYKSTDTITYTWIGRTLGTTTFQDPSPTQGAHYQVHYAGTPRTDCDITAEPPPPAFTCEANAGQLTWPDANVTKYWIYKSTDTITYTWIGRTLGTTTFQDPSPTQGAHYQVHYAGTPRTDCT